MRQRRFVWSSLCAAALVAAVAPPSRAQGWAQTIGGSGIDEATAVLAMPDGGFVVAGSTTSFGGPAMGFWILKLDALGSIEWQKKYSPGGGGTPCCLEPAAGGGFFVAGNAQSAPGQPYLPWLLRLDAAGTILLQRSYSGPMSPELHGFTELADGTLVAVGGPDESSDGAAWILRLDAGGAAIRLDEYTRPGGLSAWAVRGTADGGILVAGATPAEEYDGGGQVWLLRLDAAGRIVTHGFVARGRIVHSLDATSGGGWLLSGRTSGADLIDPESFVLALDGNLDPIWQTRFGEAGLAEPKSVLPAARPTSDGGCLIAGSVTGSTYPAGHDAAGVVATRLDAAGVVSWQRRYRGAPDAAAAALAVTSDGGAVLVGSSGGDALALRVDASGAIGPCGTTVPSYLPPLDGNGYVADVNAVATSLLPTSRATSAIVVDTIASTLGIGDVHEPDDSCLEPTVLQEGRTTRHDLCDDAADWFELRACAGVTYTIATSGLGSLADTIIDVLLPDCTSVVASDDNGGGGLASALDWMAPGDGIYLVRVRSADGSRGPDRGYDVTLSRAGSGCATWARAYARETVEGSASVAALPDGTFAVLSVAWSESDAPEFDPLIVRLGPSGDVLGSQFVTTPGWEDAGDLATTSAGLVVAGTLSPSWSGRTAGYLLERDGAGRVAWQRVYARGTACRLSRICALRAGGFAAAGEVEADGWTDLWILRVDASGSPSWDLVLRTPTWTKSTASAILETSEGGLLVVAASYAPSADHFIWAVRLDGGGSVLWQRTYGADFRGLARSVEASDGSLYLAAQDWLMKLDPAGNVAWRRVISDIIRVDLAAILATPSDGCVIAGGTRGQYGGWDRPVLISIDASGGVEWQRIGAGTESPQAVFRSMAAIPGSGYVLAGTRRGGRIAGYRQFAVRVASDGTLDGSCYLTDAAFVPSAATASWRSTSAAPVPGALVVTDAPFSASSPVVDYEELCAATNPPLPLEVSPPGSPAPLIFTDHSTLWWESGAVSGSLRFNVYRFDLRGLRWGGVMSCYIREWPFVAAADPARPWPGQAWAYLVSGVNVAGEGPLGRTSLGTPRVNHYPCP